MVPQLAKLRKEILQEFHCSRFAMHPGGTKMYCDTSNPGPTRLADPNRFPGRETQDWDSLPVFFFFFQNRTGTCGYGPHL